MNSEALARRLIATPTFAALSREQLTALVERAARRQVQAGAVVADAERGLQDYLVLLDGELEAERSWTTGDGRVTRFTWRVSVGRDGPGFSLLGPTGGHVRVQAVADAHFVAISGDELDELLGWGQLDGGRLLTRHRKVFHDVPLENVQRALERMTERRYIAGETVVAQGEHGDTYYLIVQGEAEVWLTDPLTDEASRIDRLRDGDGFGEEALLLEGSRTATVRMTTPGRLLALSKADFDELLRPQMVDEVDAARASEMLARGQARLVDCRYPTEYDEGRIPGAQLVPLDRLRREGVFTIDPAPTYIVYCRSGRRSRAAVYLLRERGIRAMSLIGGILDWPYEVDASPP